MMQFLNTQFFQTLVMAMTSLLGVVVTVAWWASKITTRLDRIEKDIEGIAEAIPTKRALARIKK